MTTDTEGSTSPSDSLPVLKKDWRFYAGMAALLLSLVLTLVGRLFFLQVVSAEVYTA